MPQLETKSLEVSLTPESPIKYFPPALFVWPLLPQNEIINQAVRTIAYVGYIDELAILGSSNLAILTHPIFSYYNPGISPFKSFIPTSDLDLLLDIGKTRGIGKIPKDINDIEDSRVIDCILSLSPYKFLEPDAFPSPVALKGNPSCWVCKSSLPNYNSNLHISISLTNTLNLPDTESFLPHQPVSYLPLTTIKRAGYALSQLDLVWPEGGQKDLQNHVVRIPDLETFFNSEPPLGTLVHLLIFSKYASIMPDAVLDSNTIQVAQNKVLHMTKDLTDQDRAHLEKRTLGMVENLAASFFNNRNAIGNFLSMLTLLGIPHNPQSVLNKYDQVKDQVFDTQAILVNKILYTYNMFPDPNQYMDNFLPLENTVT